MKANELRIGNWVQFSNGTKQQIECGSDIDNLYDPLFGEKRQIPLTPEILERCGFARITEKRIEKELGENSITFDGKEFHLCGIGAVIFGQCFSLEIKYLHQLQNLYFALTGEELEYKP